MAKLKYYDRYQRFRSNGTFRIVPYIKLPVYDTDLYIVFDKTTMRLDNLSYKYYSDPNYAWLIMLANPELGSMEFSIEDGSVMRIPYPLSIALSRYEKVVSDYIETTP